MTLLPLENGDVDPIPRTIQDALASLPCKLLKCDSLTGRRKIILS